MFSDAKNTFGKNGKVLLRVSEAFCEKRSETFLQTLKIF